MEKRGAKYKKSPIKILRLPKITSRNVLFDMEIFAWIARRYPGRKEELKEISSSSGTMMHQGCHCVPTKGCFIGYVTVCVRTFKGACVYIWMCATIEVWGDLFVWRPMPAKGCVRRWMCVKANVHQTFCVCAQQVNKWWCFSFSLQHPYTSIKLLTHINIIVITLSHLWRP